MTAAATYEPRPGTVAYRVLAHLETLPPGAEVMTSTLAEAIQADTAQIIACLEFALRAGRVFRRQKDRQHSRSPWWWSLTDHSADAPAFRSVATTEPKADAKGSAPAGPPRTVEEAWERRGYAPAPPSTTRAPDAAAAMVAPVVGTVDAMFRWSEKKSGPNPTYPMARVHPEEFRAALWSNGFLQIERFEGDLVILTKDQVEQLRALLGGGR